MSDEVLPSGELWFSLRLFFWTSSVGVVGIRIVGPLRKLVPCLVKSETPELSYMLAARPSLDFFLLARSFIVESLSNETCLPKEGARPLWPP